MNTPSILEKIRAYKLEEVAARKSRRPLAEVMAAAEDAEPTRPFMTSLQGRVADGRYGLIAEIKKASPSKGLIRPDFNPPELARAYEAGGATCLSVLTDTPSFQGADRFLTDARRAVSLPVLRKDFLYDPYQVAEARALNADCILIIMASVSDDEARALEDAADEWNMDALIEVHNAEELERALELRSRFLGINNRDLNTFETRLETTEELTKDLPKDRFVVSESGLFTPDDLARIARTGVRSFLIGESLMRQSDVRAATETLLADPLPA